MKDCLLLVFLVLVVNFSGLMGCAGGRQVDGLSVMGAEPAKGRLEHIDADDFEIRLRRGEDFVVILTYPTCNITPVLLREINGDLSFDWTGLAMLDLSAGRYDPAFLMHYIPYFKGVPTMLAVSGGKVVDMMLGVGNMEVLKRFVDRNLHGVFHPPQKLEDIGMDVKNPVSYVRSSNNLRSLDMEGADFRHVRLERRSLTGFNLRSARFDHSSLNFVSFSRSDLTGATFEGADLKYVFWGDCVCPDGSLSREHGLTCDGYGVRVESPKLPQRPVGKRNPDGGATEELYLAYTSYILSKAMGAPYENFRKISKEAAEAIVKAQVERYPDSLKPNLVKMLERADFFKEGDWRFYVFEDPRGLVHVLNYFPGDRGDVDVSRAGLIYFNR